MYQKPKYVRTCWASAENPLGLKGMGAQSNGGRKGSACRMNFQPGDTHVLAQAEGNGIVRHIWITIYNREPKALKSMKLQCFWDNSPTPAVSTPLGDFFCMNTAKNVSFENEFFSNPQGRSFNCYIPMPFKTAMKITLTNESDQTEEMLFYQVNYTLGDDVSDAMYFHSWYNREPATIMKKDYVILPPVKGTGRFLGASFGVLPNPKMRGTWFGEGEVKCYIDGDDIFPSLAGTGTEDYICTAWGQGEFCNRYHGALEHNDKDMKYAFYRFHVPDPVYFYKDIRVTIQQIGYFHDRRGQAMLYFNGLDIKKCDGSDVDLPNAPLIGFERFDDDWQSVAYFYLDKPESDLPPIIDAAHRAYGFVKPRPGL